MIILQALGGDGGGGTSKSCHDSQTHLNSEGACDGSTVHRLGYLTLQITFLLHRVTEYNRRLEQTLLILWRRNYGSSSTTPVHLKYK